MRTLFTDNWQFAKFDLKTEPEEILASVHADTPTANQTMPWHPVDVPHDWMISQTQSLYESIYGCYTKTFSVTDLSKHWFLTFEGVYMNSHYYLNGEHIFFWPYGYSTFTVDLTPYLKDGENELVVTCRYEEPNTRWYSGAGIFRKVWLAGKEDAALTENGIYVHSEETGADSFHMTVDTEAVLRSDIASDRQNAVISQTLTDASGNPVASGTAELTISSEVSVATQEFDLSGISRWDIESPTLYTLTTTLSTDGVIRDSFTQRIGFRSIRFDANEGFFLNGRHIKLNGACMHHDLGSLGAAFNQTALRRQFTSMKEMGVNAIRTSHNMPDPLLMEAADEMGLLIDSESFDMWESRKTDYDYANFFKEYWAKDVASWVRRDRNHASLIMWSIGNEIYDTHSENGLRITKELVSETRRHDYHHNAYTTIGSNYVAWEGAQRCSDQVEVSGYNYGEHLYEEHHTGKFPHWCIYGSETSSTVQSRGIYHFPASNRLLTFLDQQCSSLDNCSTNWGAKNVRTVVTRDRDIPYSAGQFIWTGWDYIGEPTPYFNKNSYFGQVDTAGFPKDSYYIYQAGWTDGSKTPMVHLLPYWDFNPGQMIDVQAYTNCPRVELFFNGISQGAFDIDQKHGEELGGKWRIPYEEGELRAVAYNADGTVACEEVKRSFTDPVKLTLTPDKTELLANGEDLIFVTITAEDKNGTEVANARNRVKVTVTGAGRLVGLDNGDSTDYDQYKGTSRKLFSGKLLAIIAAKKEAGEITMTVESHGLPAETVTFTAIASESDPHISCAEENFETPYYPEVPVRKILLTMEGPTTLTADTRETIVHATVLPENATDRTITFRAMTLDGVDSNATKITVLPDGLSAKITATGDDVYQITAFANNGKPYPEVMSVLEMENKGLGRATIDPYSLVCACQHTGSNRNPILSFQGGVFTNQETTWIRFDDVDFGEYGSDEITIPIFSFDTVLPVEVWEGTPEDGECLFKGNYESSSWYNHYQSNTFKLSRRLRGMKTVSIQLHTRLSVNGFSFTKFEKAYGTLTAAENNMINGDYFEINGDAVEKIGNNTDIEFKNMDFGTEGFRQIVICGHSHNPVNTIHVRFTDEDGNGKNQIVEFPGSDGYQELTFPLESVTGKQKVNFIFLPGSKFDFKYFRFEK